MSSNGDKKKKDATAAADQMITLCLTFTAAQPPPAKGKGKKKTTAPAPAAAAAAPAPPPSRREIVRLPKSTTTLEDLYQRAEQLFGTNDVCSGASLTTKKKRKNSSNNSTTTTTVLVVVLERRASSSSGDGGFPRRPGPVQRLGRDSNQTLQQAGIENQERITVSFLAESSAAAAKKKSAASSAASASKKRSTVTATSAEDKKKKAKRNSGKAKKDDSLSDEEDNDATTTSPSPASRKTSKRAAAQRATESFAATMAAQDALVRQEKKQQKPASSSKRATSPAAAKKKKPQFTANRTSAGRRLQDGAVVSRPTQSQPRKRRAKGTAGVGGVDGNADDDDPQAQAGMALLGALDGGNDASSGGGARLMRAGWRKAVLSAYEQNQATSRLAAAAAMPGVVQFSCWKPTNNALVAVSQEESAALSEDDNDDNNDAATTRMNKAEWKLEVKYPKGVQGRGNYEERVDYIPYAVLKNVIGAIHPANPEALRPENLALLSPRVLWSLLYHDQRRQNDAATAATTNTTRRNQNPIHRAFQNLHPDLDWSFLRRRKEQLSAKALENLRQQQSAAQEEASVGADYEAAAAAISAVEQAMEDLSTMDQSQRQARMLAAAQQRAAAAASGTATTNGDNDVDPAIIITTPTETDEDELKACVLAAVTNTTDHDNENDDEVWNKVVVSTGSSSNAAAITYTVRKVVDALIQDCAIHNWRELAHAREDVLVQQLFANNQNNLDDDDTSTRTAALMDMIEKWIDHAQDESVDEIMLEICEGQIEAVQLLQEAAKSATPKDLANWQWIVDDLHQVLQQHHVAAAAAAADGNSDDNNNVEDTTTATSAAVVPAKEDLQRWCQRAKWTLEQWEWLGDYATPIE